MYYPLGIKTDYSLLKSLIKIEDLVLYAKNNNYEVLGILDDNLNSSHMFYKLCKQAGIKPIIGLDLEIESIKVYLYPKNMEGLKVLFKLLKYKINNEITINTLKKYNQDIICVLPNESYNNFELFKNIFHQVYLSFKNHEEEKEALDITDKIVYIDLVNSLNVNQSKYINYLYMIDKNLKLGDLKLIDYSNNVLVSHEYDTKFFTDLINIEFVTDKRYIPHFSEEIKDSFSYLKELSLKGLNRRLNEAITDEYLNRLNYELNVIKDMGFTDYFLIVFDYVRFALKNNILVGAGRGSAAGSLVAYCLGITWVDPIKYDLLFERFLNPERVTMPDIDIDFEYERREEVVDYVKCRYGEERVAKIIAYSTMTSKEVLRCVAKINNVDDALLNILLKNINSKLSLKDNNKGEVANILKRNSLLKKVYEESFYLEGIKKHITTTAAGVVISSEDLTDLMPICVSGSEILTGYDKDELEELGILKMDFLSIKNLTIMANIIKDIESNLNHKININTIPLNDKKVYELFSSANTLGVFQFEAIGMQNFLRKLHPECFDDLVMSIAIYRPGPMASIDDYLNRKNNHAKITYIDESLKPILNNTYGILIYQEQIMEILKRLGNFSYAEADIIRRAISKKKINVINENKEKFITSAVKNGITSENAYKIYDLILRFADFGFNKSHSVAYAMIAYQMAYLKTYFKEFFYISILNINIGSEEKTKDYITEAKEAGITFLKPDINLSGYEYSNEDKAIRLPFRIIKGIGSSSVDVIIKEREKGKFTDFYDFIKRCFGFNINKKVLEILIYAGVFDSFNINRATLIKNINAIITYAELIKDLDSSLVSEPMLESVDEYSDIELMNKELELFNFYVSHHPASKYPNLFKQIDKEKYFDKIIDTVVIVENIKKIKTKNNKDMAFVLGSDETGNMEFICFDEVFNSLNEIKKGDLVKITGRVEKRLDKYSVIINKIIKI